MKKTRNSAAVDKTRGTGCRPSVGAEVLPGPAWEQGPSMISLKARADMVVSGLRAARCQLRMSAVEARELRAQTRQETWGLRHAGMKSWILMVEIKKNTLLGEELCEAAAPEPTANRRPLGLPVQ